MTKKNCNIKATFPTLFSLSDSLVCAFILLTKCCKYNEDNRKYTNALFRTGTTASGDNREWREKLSQAMTSSRVLLKQSADEFVGALLNYDGRLLRSRIPSTYMHMYTLFGLGAKIVEYVGYASAAGLVHQKNLSLGGHSNEDMSGNGDHDDSPGEREVQKINDLLQRCEYSGMIRIIKK